jgi:hypothetical protein
MSETGAPPWSPENALRKKRNVQENQYKVEENKHAIKGLEQGS